MKATLQGGCRVPTREGLAHPFSKVANFDGELYLFEKSALVIS